MARLVARSTSPSSASRIAAASSLGRGEGITFHPTTGFEMAVTGCEAMSPAEPSKAGLYKVANDS